jgi:uncharacterized protein YqgC (DUF456 family)
MQRWLWLLAVVLIVTGVIGTILPALPGPILVFAGVLLAAWADDFARIGPGTLVALGLLTAAAHSVDLVAAAIGVRRSGASRRAVAGAALGATGGLFFGVPGLVVGPFVGALIGELTMRGDLRSASRAGVFAGLGFVIGTLAKLGIVCAIVGIAAAAFLL